MPRMKKKYFVFCILMAFILVVMFPTPTYAMGQFNKSIERGKIENLVVTVHPRMTDGSLDILYEITWKVSNTSVQKATVNTQNEKFGEIAILSDNIAKISQREKQKYATVYFKRPYEKGESVTFKFAINQKHVCIKRRKNDTFEFEAPYSSDMIIENLTIKWKADKVAKSDRDYQEGEYLIWNQKDVPKGKKGKSKCTISKKCFPIHKNQKMDAKSTNRGEKERI